MSDDVFNLSLRLPMALVDRLDALKDAVRDDLGLDALVLPPKVSRSVVARLALLRGVEQLEAKTATPPRAPAPPKKRPSRTPMAPTATGKTKRGSSRLSPPGSVAAVKLRAWRDAKGLEQGDLAQQLGCSQTTVSLLERTAHTKPPKRAPELAELVPELEDADWTTPPSEDG
jgi:DNA-binding XRE family transcriptional regulator